MIATMVLIFNPTLVVGTTYTIELYYSPASKAKYTNHGDVIRDTMGNEYEIANSTTLPVSDGATVTVNAIGANVLPEEDADYNSSLSTPGQIRLTPLVKTTGSLSSPSVYSGPNYEYTVLASWNISSEANKAVLGDRVVDASGKEFELSFIHSTSRFTVPCRIKEVDKVGELPVTGVATLFRATANEGFFQGNELTDAARTVVRNRDMALLDDLLQNSGSSASNALEKEMTNNTGSTVSKLTPVMVNSSGELDLIDPSVEDSARATVGIVKADILDSQSGLVVLSGVLEDVSTSIAVGTDVFLSKTGEITDVEPEIDSGGFTDGDFVVRLGTIMQNSLNPSQKDLNVNIQIVGQL